MANTKRVTDAVNGIGTKGTIQVDDGSAGDSIFIGVPSKSALEAELQRKRRLARTAMTQNKFGKRPFGVGAKGFEAYRSDIEYDPNSGLNPDNWDPNDIVLLQQRLNLAGMLDSFIPFQFDKATRSAWKELLAMANTSMTPWDELLDQITSVGGKIGTTKQRAPFVAELSSEEDLRSVADAAALALHGGKLNPDEMNRFVSAFRQSELEAQQAQYNAVETGGIVNAPPSAGTAQDRALAAVKQAHPDQVFVSALGEHLKTMTPALGQPGGGWV